MLRWASEADMSLVEPCNTHLWEVLAHILLAVGTATLTVAALRQMLDATSDNAAHGPRHFEDPSLAYLHVARGADHDWPPPPDSQPLLVYGARSRAGREVHSNLPASHGHRMRNCFTYLGTRKSTYNYVRPGSTDAAVGLQRLRVDLFASPLPDLQRHDRRTCCSERK